MDGDEQVLTWRGPFASLPRAVDVATARTIGSAAFALYALAGLATLPYLLGFTGLEGANKAGMTFVCASTMVAAPTLLALRYMKPAALEWWLPTASAFGFVVSIILLSFTMYFVGPTFGSVAVYFVEIPLLGFFFMRRRYAIAIAVGGVVGYMCALIALDNPPAPAQQIVNLIAAAVATGVLIGGHAQKLDETRTELADLNRTLERRVAEQVGELERTGRLRRFLSPQIAHVVTSEGADEMLAPHRADIAVFFVDLRGFTAFTNAVTAERVMGVLAEYYESVGSALDHHGATIGGFDGDGVFAYLGDPVAHDDAATAAVAMARDIAGRLDELTASWSDDEVTLGYGIGLAHGEATLGLVGFANRADYTPVGAVVNMAARLCSEAKHREILIDDSLRKTADLGELPKRGDVDLKGFGTTETYAVSH